MDGDRRSRTGRGERRRAAGTGRTAGGLLALAGWLVALFVTVDARPAQDASQNRAAHQSESLFTPSEECMACHNSLVAPDGEDVSIGASWRASMMANSARDPYWQAGVRRETIDHPTHKAEIEDECSICHMPMMRAQAQLEGRHGEVFTHLPVGQSTRAADRLAADGVSCTLCHQITAERLGTPESFVGRFALNRPAASAPRTMFGPFMVDQGRTALMQSVTGVQPLEGKHVQQSELCATCHTLITQAFGANGEVVGSIPEQVPYQEWRHSAYREERSCQSCHMPEVSGATRMSSVLGDVRDGLHKHTFIGGNFFMLRMLNRYRGELGVNAGAAELDAAAIRTVQQLAADSADVIVSAAGVAGGEARFDVVVRNTTGHKLPTGYPSRRAWLHVTLRDGQGKVVFESGAIAPDGHIDGNDNDADASRYEPHYTEISRADQVQIYESIMGDSKRVPTTGLLTATSFLKDNRLLPRGFDKATAEPDIAVHGEARQDGDFVDAGDRVRYRVPVGVGVTGALQVDVEVRYQPISYRWAQNLKAYDAAEPKRFVGYYEAMAAGSSTVLARTHATLGGAGSGINTAGSR
jgi:hypothetical protein